MPKGWKCLVCGTRNRAVDKKCGLCPAAKPEAVDEKYINATDDQVAFWSEHGTAEEKAKVQETEEKRAAARRKTADEKAERAAKRSRREEERSALLAEQREARREAAAARIAERTAATPAAEMIADHRQAAADKARLEALRREERLKIQREKAAERRRKARVEPLRLARKCAACELELDDKQCFCCGNHFDICPAGCTDAEALGEEGCDIDGMMEHGSCEACEARDGNAMESSFVCAMCVASDRHQCQVCKSGEIIYSFL